MAQHNQPDRRFMMDKHFQNGKNEIT